MKPGGDWHEGNRLAWLGFDGCNAIPVTVTHLSPPSSHNALPMALPENPSADFESCFALRNVGHPSVWDGGVWVNAVVPLQLAAIAEEIRETPMVLGLSEPDWVKAAGRPRPARYLSRRAIKDLRIIRRRNFRHNRPHSLSGWVGR